jgi:AraC family ethanolamine operon transcriptional activator
MPTEFEPGRADAATFSDVEAAAAFALRGWTRDVLQIEPGVLQATGTALDAVSLRLTTFTWNRGFLSRGTADPRTVTLGSVASAGAEPRFQGRGLGPRMVPILPGEAEFELVAPAAGAMVLASVERGAFERHARAIWGDGLPAARAGCMVPLAAEADHRTLRAAFGAFVAALHRDPPALADPAVAVVAEDQLLGSLLQATAPSPIILYPPHRHRMARAAARFMRECLDSPTSIRAISETLGVSWRALDSGFRELFGMTPSAYLRACRLDAVRRALIDADPASSTVTGIATRWGFFHFGRFAADYRKRFGEAPSITLGRFVPRRRRTAAVPAHAAAGAGPRWVLAVGA